MLSVLKTGLRACLPPQADVQAAERLRGRTPLHEALARGAAVGCRRSASISKSAPTVAALLRAGASTAARDHHGETPVHYAVAGCDVAALAALLAPGARPPRDVLSRALLFAAERPFGEQHALGCVPRCHAKWTCLVHLRSV